MAKLGLQEIDWAYVGAVLARADSDEQVKFFKAFVKECDSWGTRLQVESQLAWINRELTNQEKECLSMLGYTE